MGFNDGSDVGCQLGIVIFAPTRTPGGEILQTADARAQLLEALVNGLAAPTKTAFRFAGVAVTEGRADL